MFEMGCQQIPGNPCCSVKYCPLVLAWATTVHKFQGFEAGFDEKDQINEAHESNDEEPQSMLQIQESPSQNKQNLAGLTPKEIFLQRPPNNTIILNYGPIPGRPPTIFFSYPPFLKIQRPYNK